MNNKIKLNININMIIKMIVKTKIEKFGKLNRKRIWIMKRKFEKRMKIDVHGILISKILLSFFKSFQ